MREIALIEWTDSNDVSVLARSDDPELLDHVTRALAALERRRLARLEGPVRLAPVGEEPGDRPVTEESGRRELAGFAATVSEGEPS